MLEQSDVVREAVRMYMDADVSARQIAATLDTPRKRASHPPRYVGVDGVYIAGGGVVDRCPGLGGPAAPRGRQVPPFGPIWARFPGPVPLTRDLVTELYEGCGVALAHIELLTGQPAETVREHLARWGVALRARGGSCPFPRRLSAEGMAFPRRQQRRQGRRVTEERVP